MSDAPFHRRVVVWLVVISAVSFAVGLVFSILGPEIALVASTDTDTYSQSAIGHRALVETLRRLDVPVTVSRFSSGSKVRDSGVLLVAEPRIGPKDDDLVRKLQTMVDRAPHTLLVLPKWRGVPDDEHEGWIRRATLVEPDVATDLLSFVGISDTQLRRVDGAQGSVAHNPLAAAPTLPATALQVLDTSRLLPVVALADGGVVLGRSQNRAALYVLSDPDLLSNAGLHRGENALFVLAALAYAGRDGGAVVVDETLHGHELIPSIWRDLSTFPLVLLTANLLLLLAVLLWAGMGRFGAPHPVPPPLEPGTHFLVENTARLLGHGRRAPAVLPRYLDVNVRAVRRALRPPPGLKGAEEVAWLDRVAERRGAKERLADLKQETRAAAGRPARVLTTARRVYRWRQEILHGPQ